MRKICNSKLNIFFLAAMLFLLLDFGGQVQADDRSGGYPIIAVDSGGYEIVDDPWDTDTYNSNVDIATIEGDYSYIIINGKAEIVRYRGAGGNVVIPDTLGGVPVASIGYRAFEGSRSTLTSVTIPDGVTNIGNAFLSCNQLTSVSIGQGTSSIGNQAFAYCVKLTNIMVNAANTSYSSVNGVLYSKDGSVLVCCPAGLTAYSIPETVTSISDNAFNGCNNFTNIYIPAGVKTIGNSVFMGCSDVESYNVAANNPYFYSVNGLLLNSAGPTLIACPAAATQIIIPSDVTKIAKYAIHNYNIVDISVPAGVNVIESHAFTSCTDLSSITVDSANPNFKSVDGVVYNSSGSVLITCPEGITNLSIPSTVREISKDGLWGCRNLTNINIPGGVAVIGDYAFAYCNSLTSFTVDAGNSSYSSIDGSLYDSDGTSLLACPGGFTGINMGSNVDTIGPTAFWGCNKLTDIIIPAAIGSIGANGLFTCEKLTSVTFKSATTEIADSVKSIPFSAKIIGYDPSTAQAYANKYDRAFESIAVDTGAITNFVTRFYTLCLNRQPDQGGLDYWVNKLATGQLTGAAAAQNFIMSPEFVVSNVSDSTFLDIMYQAFFNRTADSGGKAYWQGQLDNGLSRLFVLSNFVNSNEFNTVCTSYGITRGSISLSDPADLYPQVTAFVNRFYVLCLERKADSGGLNYWVDQLLTGAQTGADLSQGFIFSPEFEAQALSNSDFLTVMYRAFFNREPDSGGITYWQGQMAGGMSRLGVLANFVNPAEFAAICSNYGINPGAISY